MEITTPYDKIPRSLPRGSSLSQVEASADGMAAETSLAATKQKVHLIP